MNKDRQLAFQALKELEDRTGRLLPTEVIEAASDPASPLHKYITWDPDKALEKVQMRDARNLIHSYRIEFKHGKVTKVRTSWVRDVTKPNNKEGYRELTKATRSKHNAQATLLYYLRRAVGSLEGALEIAIESGLEEHSDAITRALEILANAEGSEQGHRIAAE